MGQDKIVVINGRKYDAKTGLPIETSSNKVTKPSLSSSRIHSMPQRSKTLVRKITKKPEQLSRPAMNQRLGRVMDIAKSSKISRFAGNKLMPTPNKQEPAKKDLSPQKHPMAERAEDKRTIAAQKPIQKTSKEIKNEAISSAIAKSSFVKDKSKRNFFKRHPKSIMITLASSVIIILGAYLTYVNMPNLSVKFASMQAGIEATYPDYRPDGYSLDGPVSYSDGEVTIKFKANTGNTKFTLTQTKSSWDSSAVLDNIVKKKAGEQYITSQERGLTIYTYSGNGAWVNGGILYTIEGDAPLSIDQIRHIATSM